MRKSDKKIDNEIIRRLTEVCEAAKQTCTGFVWLTHEVNYQRFPQSLHITLVFDGEVAEAILLSEFRGLVIEVQRALEPVVGGTLPANQIEARREHALH